MTKHMYRNMFFFLSLALLSSCHFNYPEFTLVQESVKPFWNLDLKFLLVLDNNDFKHAKIESPFPDSVKINNFYLEIRRADNKHSLRTALQLERESFEIVTPDTSATRLSSHIEEVQTIGNFSEVWIVAGPIPIPKSYKGDFTMSFNMTHLNVNPPYIRDTIRVQLKGTYNQGYKLYPTRKWEKSVQ